MFHSDRSKSIIRNFDLVQMLYLADFKAATINIYKELKENMVLMKKLLGNLNIRMKILKMQKENSKLKSTAKHILNSRVGKAEESLNLNIGY